MKKWRIVNVRKVFKIKQRRVRFKRIKIMKVKIEKKIKNTGYE